MKIRKKIAGILAACMLAGTCVTPVPVFADDAAKPVYGDANTDGAVDVADAVLDARFYAEDSGAVITEQGRINGDVNADGAINSEDIRQILEFISRKRNTLGPAQPVSKLTKTVDLMEGITASDPEQKELDDAFLLNQFDLTARLLKEIFKDSEPDENILISPLSLSLALGMTANGAKEETLAEMQQVLGGDLDIEALNAYYRTYLSCLPSTKREKLNIANSLWIKDDESKIIVPQTFLQTTKDYYDAGVFRAPFDEGTVKDLNQWVSDHTDGLIPEMISELDSREVMVLVNALYFDARWADVYTSDEVSTFDFFLNEDLDFDDDAIYDRNVLREDKIEVRYMSNKEDYYVQDETAVGFVKPYSGDDYSFVGLLPNNGVKVRDYIEQMTGESLKKLMDSKTKKMQRVFTCLPKFRCKYEINLCDTLKALGMKKAFSRDTADFTGLNEFGETWISKVLHKTAIDVNELGTQAAAVTSVHAMDGAGVPEDRVEVYLQRPFIYMIVDNQTNLPLFIGTMMHPEYEET